MSARTIALARSSEVRKMDRGSSDIERFQSPRPSRAARLISPKSARLSARAEASGSNDDPGG